MGIEAPARPRAVQLALMRTAVGLGRRQTLIAAGVYSVLSLAFFGAHTLAHPGHECVCTGLGNDPGTYMWYLAWWPHAVLHGINPFFTDAVFAPDRVDIGAVALVPGAALVAAPVTLLLGPLVSYNLIALASPVLAAVFAFLLCRYLTNRFPAALIGGYLFGFSAYMLGHMLGHLNLVLTFPIPAGIHLVLRLIDGRIGTRRFIALMTLDLVALVSFSNELALTALLLGAVTLIAAVILVPERRSHVSEAIRPIVLAIVLALIITSPLIYYALKGNIAGAFAKSGDIWGGDALAFLVPTRLIGLGSSSFGVVSSTFNENDLAESGLYLGIPLALIIVRYIVTRWRLAMTRVLFAVLLVVCVLLLGSRLHIDGQPTISLPWRVVAGLPLIKQVLPVRLGVYMFLIAAVICAMWIARPRAGGWGAAKVALLAAALAFLLPNVGRGLWHSRPSNPSFFTTTLYRKYLHRGETVLTLPWAGFHGYGMLWQADTGMWFRLAGGNLGKLLPADYGRDPILSAFLHPQLTNVTASLRSFLVRHRVGAVIVDPNEPQQWPTVLPELGMRQIPVGGILLYRFSG